MPPSATPATVLPRRTATTGPVTGSARAGRPGLDESIEHPARCADGNGTLSHLFFSDDDHDIARAKAICGPCGRRSACLAGAVERGEPYGVWGGMLLLDGVPVEFKGKRGRPPKRPAPPLVLDEVPLPPHLVA